MSVVARTVLLVLILLPAAALCVLGLRSIRGDSATARQDAEARAERIRDDLEADLRRSLDALRAAVESRTPPPLSFRVEASGRIARPVTRSFPAHARSFEAQDLVVLRELLEAADRALLRDEDPDAAVELLEPALDLFEEEDLDAVVRDRAALAFEKAERTDRALELLHETIDLHPGARDLDGFPLAVPAAIRAAEMLRAVGREAEAATVDRRLADLVAENPWGLREEQRTLLRRDLPRVPADILYDAVRGLVLPEIARGETPPSWTTYRGRAGGGPVLVTLRRTETDEVVGTVIPVDDLRAQLVSRAAELAAVTGAEVGVAEPPGSDGASSGGPFAPPFEDLSAYVTVRPDARGRMLGLLWAILSVLLLGGLGAGVALGLGAVRREVRLARLRQDLLDNVSHEMRTPLASIRTLAENLRDGAVPEDRRAEYFSALDRESRRVARLVEDVLDLARLDRGAGPTRREALDAGKLAREAVEALRSEPGAEDFTVRIDVAGELPEVLGDADALRRALLNLLVNAARYSRETREADVAVGATDGNLLIAVRDHGPGIPPAERRAIFDRFHRVSSETHEVKGTGLGLPLARGIVEAHGGRIVLESEVGRGSTFTIEIPLENEA